LKSSSGSKSRKLTNLGIQISFHELIHHPSATSSISPKFHQFSRFQSNPIQFHSYSHIELLWILIQIPFELWKVPMRKVTPYSIPDMNIFYFKFLELAKRYFEPLQIGTSLKIQIKSKKLLCVLSRPTESNPLPLPLCATIQSPRAASRTARHLWPSLAPGPIGPLEPHAPLLFPPRSGAQCHYLIRQHPIRLDFAHSRAQVYPSTIFLSKAPKGSPTSSIDSLSVLAARAPPHARNRSCCHCRIPLWWSELRPPC
jgi:hypothetical protein